MAFLELNGITVPVTNATARRRIERRGSRSRSFRGALRDSRRGLRRQWEIEICFPEREEGEAFVRLIQGDGHFFDFSAGPEASTWLHPNAGLEGLEFAPNIWGARGRGVGHVKARTGPSDPSGFFRVDAQLGEAWCVLWAEKQAGGGSFASLGWDFFAKRSDGTGYASGSRDDSVGEVSGGSSLVSVDLIGGELVLRNDTATDFSIDDLLILPWSAPNSWLQTLTTIDPMAPKLPAMPVLTARGDFIESAFAYVVGDITGIDFIQRPSVVPGLGWVNNAMKIRARLSEVDPAFYCVEDRIEDTVRPPGTTDPAYWFTTSDIDDLSNASLEDGDSITSWTNQGTTSAVASSIDATQPVYRARGDFPSYRAPVCQWSGAPASRLQTGLPATIPQPNTILCVYRTTDPVGTATQYLVDGASANRQIIRIGSYAFQQAYAGTFLGTGNTATVREWNVGIFHANGASSLYRWNGNDTAGNAGAFDLQGITLGGLYNTTGNNTANGDLVELIVWDDSPGSGGVPTVAEIEQYVTDRYSEGV